LPPFRQPPTLQFERVANFRDLGGHSTADGLKVRSGRLFRSGHLGHASDRDTATLGELGIRRVFDFRTLADIDKDGADRLPDGANHLRLPMPDPAAGDDIRHLIKGGDAKVMHDVFGDGKARAMMVDAAIRLVRDRREPYRIFLSELAECAPAPALFHCSAGKDRAGWAASLVLLTLGVPEEQVIEQYMLSNREVEAIHERLASADDVRWEGLLAPLIGVDVDYIQASFDAIAADWGSFDRYLHEGLGISERQREALRRGLLE
jgi:protein-tyrosine phosphatase